MNRLFETKDGNLVDKAQKQLHGAKYNYKRDEAIFLSSKKRKLEQSDQWVINEANKMGASGSFWRGVELRVDATMRRSIETGGTHYLLKETEGLHLMGGITPIFHQCGDDIFVWTPMFHGGEVMSSWFNIKDHKILSLFLVLYPRYMDDIVFLEDFHRTEVVEYIKNKSNKIIDETHEVHIHGFLRINEEMEHIAKKYIHIQENFDGNSIVYKSMKKMGTIVK